MKLCDINHFRKKWLLLSLIGVVVIVALSSSSLNKSEDPEDLLRSLDGNITDLDNSTASPYPAVATIEIFAIVDHTLANILGSDEEINDHISSIWNAANRFYRQFKTPEIKLKLVGLHIFRNFWEEVFFIFKHINGRSLLHQTTLLKLRLWLNINKEELPKHDLAYLHFGLVNYEGRGGNSLCSTGNGAKSVAYGDTWGESSSAPRVCAHELGHVLGCKHCDQSGYVMCSGDKVAGFYQECEEVINSTINSLMGDCISRFDADDEQLAQYNFSRTIMPGDVLSLDIQCERHHFIKGAKAVISDSNCDLLVCLLPSGKKSNSSIPAVGTKELCPEGQRCFEGICKEE